MPAKNTTQLVCVAEFFARDGKTGELIDALHALMKTTRTEAGCLRFELNQRADQPNGLTFIEKWRDQEALDEHRALPFMKAFFDDTFPRLVERSEIKFYQEILP